MIFLIHDMVNTGTGIKIHTRYKFEQGFCSPGFGGLNVLNMLHYIAYATSETDGQYL
jgi:hypothetical protein